MNRARGGVRAGSLLMALLSVCPWCAFAQDYDLGAAADLAADPRELRQTWEQAWLNIPEAEDPPRHLAVIGPLGSEYVQRRLRELPGEVKRPTVVFMHGCAGIQQPERQVEKFLTRMGFAVIFPNSEGRSFRPRDCNILTGAWGMFPIVDLYRRSELMHAMARVDSLPWVDADNVFLGGFGEGGKAVALWGGSASVRGYLVTGWTCTAPAELGWLGGLRTPPDVPVFAVVTRRDPHFRWIEFQGDCGQAAPGHEFVDSLVIDGTVHNVFVYPETAERLASFMLAHTRSPFVPSRRFRALGLRIGLGADPDVMRELYPAAEGNGVRDDAVR